MTTATIERSTAETAPPDLSRLYALIAQVTEDCTPEQIATALGNLATWEAALKDCKRSLNEAMTERVKKSGDVTVGDKRYYYGPEKEVEDKNREDTGEALLMSYEGDFRTFVREALCSNPFKIGAARKQLGDSFGDYFTERTVMDLKTGKPLKKLHVVPTYLMEK